MFYFNKSLKNYKKKKQCIKIGVTKDYKKDRIDYKCINYR